jgi:hypothetical protein
MQGAGSREYRRVGRARDARGKRQKVSGKKKGDGHERKEARDQVKKRDGRGREKLSFAEASGGRSQGSEREWQEAGKYECVYMRHNG